MSKGKKVKTPVQNAAELASKETAAQLAEQHKMEQEANDLLFRVEQQKRAQGIAAGILTESTGGTALTLAVGEGCYDYVNADLLRGTPGDTGRFTESMRQVKKDIKARLTTDVEPNISRYLGFAALAILWDREKLLTLPKTFVQDACTMVSRDDTAPGLEYTENTPRGPEKRSAYSWLTGCETAGPALLEKAAAGIGTCQAMTLAEFTAARKEFCSSGQGRHNQGGKNKGKNKGKGQKAAAKKAAAKLAAAIKAIKDFAAVATLPVPFRLKGLRMVSHTARELSAELKANVGKPAVKGKPTANNAAEMETAAA